MRIVRRLKQQVDAAIGWQRRLYEQYGRGACVLFVGCGIVGGALAIVVRWLTPLPPEMDPNVRLVLSVVLLKSITLGLVLEIFGGMGILVGLQRLWSDKGNTG